MLSSTPGLGLPCEHHYLLASKSGYAVGPIDTIQEDHSLMQLAGTLKIPLIESLKYQQCPCFVFLEASVTGAPDLSHRSEPKAPERGWRGGSQAFVALHGLMQEAHIWCAAMPLPLNTILGTVLEHLQMLLPTVSLIFFILLQSNSNQRMHSSCKTVDLCCST